MATPYAKLREPVPLTPVIKSAHSRHAQVCPQSEIEAFRPLVPHVPAGIGEWQRWCCEHSGLE